MPASLDSSWKDSDPRAPTPEDNFTSGEENEYGPNRNHGVQDKNVRARVPLPSLSAGRHTVKIRMIDRINLPEL